MRPRFIILGAGSPHQGEQHTALRAVGGASRVLDWTLRAVSFLDAELHFVAGYQADSVRAVYPEFRYWLNPDWGDTGAAWSLLLGPVDPDGDCLVAYADIVFRENVVLRFMESRADVTVAIDSQWRTRFAGRTDADVARCEKACTHEGAVTRLGADIAPGVANAEFVGLVRLSPSAVARLAQLRRTHGQQLRRANLSELVELLRMQGLRVAAVDVCGDWAELNEPQDLARFVLGTKAQTLQRLKAMVTRSRIEDQVSFTVAEWRADQAAWVERIQRQFGGRNVVVRSSALSEDGFLSSNAGVHTSLLYVESGCPGTLARAVEEVIASYPDANPGNEVLVQPMLAGVAASGVVFTRSLATGAPYYVANFDDVTGSTESITSGASREHQTLVMRRDVGEESPRIPEKLRGLLPALREIESLLGYDSLDIEFAVTEDHGLHVLQVRPIAVDHSGWGASDAAFGQLLAEAERRFERLALASPYVVGSRSLYGMMPDWNPAEIIGTKPAQLAISLYRELIMDDTWATQRAEYGYRDVRPQPLLECFAGHPYVDVRASFSSFVPASLGDDIAQRLVDFCLGWLERHPELHDKVEFEVVPTCFGLDFPRWEQRLVEEGGFNKAEVGELRDALRAITVNALGRNAHDLATIARLESRYTALRDSGMPPLEKACALLDDARLHGTLPFAHLARSAFVAMTLLRSAVATGVLQDVEMEDFLNTIRTVSHMLTHDARACAHGELAWDAFVEKYGHLRPGTYDVVSSSYRQDPERYLRPIVARATGQSANGSPATGSLWRAARGRFAAALAQAGLPGDADSVERFLREAIEGREYSKFAFTRNLSLALDELVAWAQSLGVGRDDLAQVSVADLWALRTGSVTVSDVSAWLKERAAKAAERRDLVAAVELPPLLCRREDFSVFVYPATHANFIGSRCVVAACADLERCGQDADIAGRIVLIPQADPGYDWLFGRQIAGLITMYGGANSHMAIRAAEFGLPAAIGVGETRFRSLAVAQEIELNPASRTIRVIR